MKEESQDALECLIQRYLVSIFIKQLGATPEVFLNGVINIHASRYSCKSCDPARPAPLWGMAIQSLVLFTLMCFNDQIEEVKRFSFAFFVSNGGGQVQTHCFEYPVFSIATCTSGPNMDEWEIPQSSGSPIPFSREATIYSIIPAPYLSFLFGIG